MNTIEILFIAVGLAMDAFAISICIGLTAKGRSFKKALVAGIYFGGSQAVMPLLGYAAGSNWAGDISTYDHWVAFAVLLIIGAKMIKGSFDKTYSASVSLEFASMMPLAVATSVDALAVGVSFSFLDVRIIPTALLIGAVTFSLSMSGVKAGNLFGMRYKSKAELAGGVILVLMGLKIVLEHTVFTAAL
ncbi:MAG: manganese efflux pump MntP family protein [Synergistaceae bacterium]|jgi:putative Mn2+ efflux pump MntP|nr:manganese efflux pump MntP family protein [Synergistaceae bacterium]